MALQSADVNALARLDGAGAGNEVSSTLLCCVALSCIVQVRKVSHALASTPSLPMGWVVMKLCARLRTLRQAHARLREGEAHQREAVSASRRAKALKQQQKRTDKACDQQRRS